MLIDPEFEIFLKETLSESGLPGPDNSTDCLDQFFQDLQFDAVRVHEQGLSCKSEGTPALDTNRLRTFVQRTKEETMRKGMTVGGIKASLQLFAQVLNEMARSSA